MSVKSKLNNILHHVKNPGRYIGGESNQIVKDPQTVLASMALVFPDVYEMGMSHNGTRVLYYLLNREADLAAERAFAPAVDMAALMRDHQIPLYTLESYRPIHEFEAIGISLQTELNYTNVPYVLELGGVKAFSRDRAEEDPFVIGGGPCMANPEPVADFYDLFVIGDGEFVAPKILRIIGEGRRDSISRRQILEKLAELPGVYIPQFLETTTNEYGEVVPLTDMARGSFKRTQGVRRTWIEVLNRDDYPVANPVPHMNLIHERFAIEVMRGCTQGCRFCQAGYWYRPNRELHPDDVVDLAKAGMEATGEHELGLLSLSTADYGQVSAVTDYLVQDPYFDMVNLSLPSLRANSYGQDLAMKTAFMGSNRNATFAPETGSERLRKLINKTISDQDMYDAAEAVFANGFHKIKLYTMVGLPTENLDDMEAFCQLIKNLNKIGQKYHWKNQVHADIGILVPKPFTPMQWIGLMPREQVDRHIRYVLNYFKGVRSVKITWADYDLTHVESFYSKGDRSLSAMIYEAYRRGQVMESFSEHFDYNGWQAIWAEFGFDQRRVYDDRPIQDHVFPWDFIHAGVSKGYLRAEYKKMFDPERQEVLDCKWSLKDCQHCGIPGNYLDIQLAEAPEKYQAEPTTVAQIKQMAAERREMFDEVFKYRLTYAKKDLARFLAHQITMDIIVKTLRRLKLRFQYTQGFNPRPIIKNSGALPLGMESQCEMVVIALRTEMAGDLKEWREQISALLPDGMDIVDITPIEKTKMPRVENVTYRLRQNGFGDSLLRDVVERFDQPDFKATVRYRDKDFDLGQEIQRVWIEDHDLLLVANANSSGASSSPYVLYSGLLGKTPDEARNWLIRKESLTFTEPKSA